MDLEAQLVLCHLRKMKFTTRGRRILPPQEQEQAASARKYKNKKYQKEREDLEILQRREGSRDHEQSR
jgi:hypothetical protein